MSGKTEEDAKAGWLNPPDFLEKYKGTKYLILFLLAGTVLIFVYSVMSNPGQFESPFDWFKQDYVTKLAVLSNTCVISFFFLCQKPSMDKTIKEYKEMIEANTNKAEANVDAVEKNAATIVELQKEEAVQRMVKERVAEQLLARSAGSAATNAE